MSRLTRAARRRTPTGPPGPRRASDRGALGIAGAVFGAVGLFVLPIVFGPLAVLFGYSAAGGRGAGLGTARRAARAGGRGRPVAAVVAIVLGIVDTVLAIVLIAASPGAGPLA
ncbi:small hydrophobic protein [Streptomyces triticagri]|uniref:Small hydrophobic protein n=1 Tax=Streptomyces triticagri TaxID=2293568 RepID=A0A372M3J5_9ACTN|nr:small hydrophobic protein [Streptomyces triticagri]RFU85506.1 small hydrophobic protein [Streptomyces triticagri]